MPTHPSLNHALESHRIWGQMPPSARAHWVRRFEVKPFSAGELVCEAGQMGQRLAWILEGSWQAGDPDLGHQLVLGPQEVVGAGITPPSLANTWQVIAASNGRAAWLGADALAELCASQPALRLFFPCHGAAGPEAATRAAAPANWLGAPVRSLLQHEPVTLPPTASIQAAAARMQQRRVSSVLLTEGGKLVGLITDRDLRGRVVALGLDITRPVSDIATLRPMTVQAHRPSFEALLLMARHQIHHLPVMESDTLLGMLTPSNLSQHDSLSPVVLVSDIDHQDHLEGLVRLSSRVKDLQQHLAANDASAFSTGHIITAITDAITVRLITLAERELGPPPVPYLWVAAGSQARNEQTAKSDQDNCLILDDAYRAEAHGAYFSALSRQVCDGLAACGYVHCPGEMMAMTDTWRQPRKVWAEYFGKWIRSPKPKALMLTCVFFDLRGIHGQMALLESLRQEVLTQTRGNSLFLAHMVSNALKHRPPLGLFGQISLSKGGDHPGAIDLKHTGIVPIVDLARVYALAAGVSVANTQERLEATGESGEVSPQAARDLRDALEFLGKLRIAHQARQTRAGQAPDNHLSLEELSNFERSQLKNAFAVVQTLQGVLGQRYAGGRFN